MKTARIEDGIAYGQIINVTQIFGSGRMFLLIVLFFAQFTRIVICYVQSAKEISSIILCQPNISNHDNLKSVVIRLLFCKPSERFLDY